MRKEGVNLFSTAVLLWGQTRQFSSSLSVKRDCSPKRINTRIVGGRLIIYELPGTIHLVDNRNSGTTNERCLHFFLLSR